MENFLFLAQAIRQTRGSACFYMSESRPESYCEGLVIRKPDPAQQPAPGHPIGPDCAFYLLSEGQHSPQLSWKICLAEPNCQSLRLFLVILGPRRELVKTSAHTLSPTSSIVWGPCLHMEPQAWEGRKAANATFPVTTSQPPELCKCCTSL